MYEERYRERRNFLATLECHEMLGLIRDSMAVMFRFALVGGLAVTYHANPPSTMDVDVLVECMREDSVAIQKKFPAWSCAPLWFPGKQKGIPRHGIQLRQDGEPPREIDFLFTGNDRFLINAVRMAIPVKIGGNDIPVIAVEDLVIMKSLVGRDKDMADIQELYRATPDMNVDYINDQIDILM